MYRTGLEDIEKYLIDNASEHDGYQIRNDVSDIIRRTELARADFRKNPTVENGWNLLNACEGRKTA